MFTRETREEIEFIAEGYDWNPAALLAVAEVESAGVYEWDVNGIKMPPIRWEGHYFYKRLKGAKLKRAVSEGLAHPRAGGVKNPRSYAARYDLLERAKAIDEKAALESISMGLGQVMGKWWKKLGYDSVQAMFWRAQAGITGQIEIMSRYIDRFNLGHTIKGTPTLSNFQTFARGYNGKAYRRNRYARKMFAAFKRWSVVFSSGSRGIAANAAGQVSRVDILRAFQTDLITLGYEPGKVDGDLGRKTKAAVREFQKDHALVEDGRPGPMVREMLDEELANLDKAKGNKAIKAGVTTLAPTLAADSAGQFLLDKVEAIQASGITSMILDYTLTGLTLVGVSLLVYGLYKKFVGGDYDA